MQKTIGIVMLAAFVAAAVVPVASASVNARTFWDLAVGVEFGDGLGLYDASTPPVYCAALNSFYTGVSPVLSYYTGVRYFPGLAASVDVTPGVHVADPTNCATLVPGDFVNAPMAEVDAGSAVWSFNLLGLTEVANLGATTVKFQYCSDPAANAHQGTQWGLDPPKVFHADYATCNSAWTSYTLYNGAGACAVFSMNTQVGSLDGDQPVFLSNGASCNTLVGSPSSLVVSQPPVGAGLALLAVTGSDYVAQHCVSTTTTDTTNGGTSVDADSDFFVVAHDGSLAGWASTTSGAPPSNDNVANLEEDAAAPSC